jgi:translation initiation factor IF-3
MPLQEALQKAKERNLDLIQVTEKVEPPVCKIGDYGKYLYSLQKKERKAKKKTTQVKGVRISFGISLHDLETRVNQAAKFLKKGDKVKVELILRGRQKAHRDFAENKMNQFIEMLQELVPIKIDQRLKKSPRGLTMIISRE